jgi:hypothetical protein
MWGAILLMAAMGLAASPTSATPKLFVRDIPVAEEDTEIEEETASEESDTDELAEAPEGDETPVIAARPGEEWVDYPNACETFTVIEGSKRVKNEKTGKMKYPLRFKRNRFKRKRSDQRRTRELIRLVAQEMGANEAGQYLVDMIAHHESSWNPEAIHILNRDLDKNLEAREHFSYDAGREKQLQQKLQTTSAKTPVFWKIKAELANLRMYKGNPFWNAQLEYAHKIPERTLHAETTEAMEFTERRSVWGYGYGLFGMNSVLYTHVFDKTAPPWVLCGDEGIIAVVTAIWALREQQSDCAYLTNKNPERWGTNGGNARGVVHRFASGHCGDGKFRGAWRRLMESYDAHIDWDKAPDFGNLFPKYKMHRKRGKWVYTYETVKDPKTGETKRDERERPVYRRDSKGRKVRIPTDRQAILAHMREKGAEKGLLREQPLERKKPDSDPVVVATMGAAASAP